MNCLCTQIKSAKTDSTAGFASVDAATRPEVANLFAMFAALSGKPLK